MTFASDKGTRVCNIDSSTKTKPHVVSLLNDWQYCERSVHRILAGWGRHLAPWEDKSAWHRHIWDQAECVRRLRDRIGQFPGGNPDAAVSPALEQLGNCVLFAPTFDDALDGIHALLSKALMGAYVGYTQSAHPVHDAPTIALLHEINQIKSQQWLWYRNYRRRHPHETGSSYRSAVEAGLSQCGRFTTPLAVPRGKSAQPVGVGTDFALPKFSARNVPIKSRHDFLAYVRADFRTNLEARRLFWAYAYLLEKNLPDDMLFWIYYGHAMPWEWQYDVSRHLWDESRHGDSGLSRLQDFGISIEEVGFPSYNNKAQAAALDAIATGETSGQMDCYLTPKSADIEMAEPMTPKSLYDSVFFIGMIAENGHFIVKNEAFQDFKEGRDLDSAEMMLFDIIDETAHVQYAHRWLPLLAKQAGVDITGYREKAAVIRAEFEKGESTSVGSLQLSRDPANPAFSFYCDLLSRIRKSCPLTNADTCPPRSPKPM